MACKLLLFVPFFPGFVALVAMGYWLSSSAARGMEIACALFLYCWDPCNTRITDTGMRCQLSLVLIRCGADCQIEQGCVPEPFATGVDGRLGVSRWLNPPTPPCSPTSDTALAHLEVWTPGTLTGMPDRILPHNTVQTGWRACGHDFDIPFDMTC